MSEWKTQGFKSIRWIADDKYRLWLHTFFWAFLYVDEMLAIIGLTDIPGVNIYTVVFFLFIDMCTVYFNLYILVPTYLMSNKIMLFLAFSIISILINIELQFLLRFELACVDCILFEDASVINQLISDFAATTFVVGTAIGANIMRRFVKSQMRVQRLETEQLKSEINFLKAQINPHLLFNSLNNIYVQTRKRPEEAAESVLILSDLMRYQLYDCAKEKVNLDDEIEYLKNYLRIDKLRKSNSNVDFDVIGDPKAIKVAPFLFIPFVENAVTHGISSDEGAFIDIDFTINEDVLDFKISNSKPKIANKKLDGGIGLNNIKRRLELLYPNQYELDIANEADKFTVSLTLNLKEELV